VIFGCPYFEISNMTLIKLKLTGYRSVIGSNQGAESSARNSSNSVVKLKHKEIFMIFSEIFGKILKF